jgi:predicted ester cyclase
VSIEANKELIRRYYDEVLNGGDLELLDELAAPDYVENDPFPDQRTGRVGLKDRVTILRTAFTQRWTLEDVVAEGNKVAARWTSTGTHTGDFMGIDFYRITDLKMAEHWHVVDMLGLMQQLGLLPNLEDEAAT